jgi:hypothetical protein
MSWISGMLKELHGLRDKILDIDDNEQETTTVTVEDSIDLQSLRVVDLRALCSERNITGTSRFNKAELIEVLQKNNF